MFFHSSWPSSVNSLHVSEDLLLLEKLEKRQTLTLPVFLQPGLHSWPDLCWLHSVPCVLNRGPLMQRNRSFREWSLELVTPGDKTTSPERWWPQPFERISCPSRWCWRFKAAAVVTYWGGDQFCSSIWNIACGCVAFEPDIPMISANQWTSQYPFFFLFFFFLLIILDLQELQK